MIKLSEKQIEYTKQNLQDGLGLGSFILKPLGNGKSEFVPADKFIPIQFDDDGRPVDCAFVTVRKVGDKQYYTKLERHRLDNTGLTIENSVYYSTQRNDIGRNGSRTDKTCLWELCHSLSTE